MKTTLFVLLTALTLTACNDEKPQATNATETKTVLAQVNITPASRVHHRMQLEPVAADKFGLARKN